MYIGLGNMGFCSVLFSHPHTMLRNTVCRCNQSENPLLTTLGTLTLSYITVGGPRLQHSMGICLEGICVFTRFPEWISFPIHLNDKESLGFSGVGSSRPWCRWASTSGLTILNVGHSFTHHFPVAIPSSDDGLSLLADQKGRTAGSGIETLNSANEPS